MREKGREVASTTEDSKMGECGWRERYIEKERERERKSERERERERERASERERESERKRDGGSVCV